MSDRRTELLNAAIEQIAKKGTRGMRVEEVAKAAGVSTGLVYHHFKDRSTFLQSALEHIDTQAAGYTTTTDGTAREVLLSELVNEIQENEVVRTNSAAWGELRDTAIFDFTLRPTIARLTQRWIDDIAKLVSRGHEDGSLSPRLDPQAIGIQLSAVVEGISGRWLTGQLTTAEAREQLASLVTLILEGAAARA